MAKTALYTMYDSNEDVLYVGIAADPFRRFSQHRGEKPWFHEVSDISIDWFDSRIEAEMEEGCAIRDLKPKYNKILGRNVSESDVEEFIRRKVIKQLIKSLQANKWNVDLNATSKNKFYYDGDVNDKVEEMFKEFGSYRLAGEAVWLAVEPDTEYPYGTPA